MKRLSLYIAAIMIAFSAAAAVTEDNLRIYLNPGHGGYDSNDRNVVIYPFSQGDEAGYWESKSNLVKGLALRDMLQKRGITVGITRTTNTSADDLGLSTIAALGNASNSDMFFSIHSNATGIVSRRNFPLMLFKGYDAAPDDPVEKQMCSELFDQLIKNQATVWTSTSTNIRGCMDFYGWTLGVLRTLTIPGMLSEGSFHDYVPEAYRLMNEDYCWYEALHFMKAIDDHFGLKGEDCGYIGGVILDSRVVRDFDYIMFEKDNQMPLMGATVKLYDNAGKLVDEYVTDDMYNGFYSFKHLTPGEYTVKVSCDKYYDGEGSITVTANEVAYKDIFMNKVRTTAPEVLSYSPVWNSGDEAVLCNTPIVYHFNWDMDLASTEAAFSISPAIDGEFSWSDSNYCMTFTPSESYKTNTEYTVTLGTTAEHGGGMTMVKPFVIKFKTDDKDYIDIIGQSIKAGDEVHFKGATVMLQTDEIMNSTGLYDKISVVDAAGDNCTFNTRSSSSNKTADKYGWVKMPLAKSLTVGEKYTLTLGADICDYDGIPVRGGEQVIEFTAVNAGAAKDGATQVYGFEDATKFAANADESNGYSAATIVKDMSNELFGTAALTFNATFSGEEGAVVYDLAEQSDVTVSVEDKVGMHVYGDMSGNDVYAMFTSGADVKSVKVTTLGFWSWKYITVDLSSLGAGKDYKFSGIKIAQTNAKMGVKSSFKCDELLKLAGAGGVEDIQVESLTVYPNPATEYLIANAGTTIMGVELYNTNGVKVARAAGNVLNVSDIESGNYILKVIVAAGSTQRQVIIKH